MSERVLDRVMAMADQLRDQAAEAERIGRLADDSVKAMKAAGLIRLLQTKQYGGFEAHPREWAETVMATAALDPAAGWIVGVVGVHPYQLAYADPKVPAEIWADDVDTWMASPYAPQGVAKPVDGGFIFNGRWQFSSGTDHCDWIILGAMLANAEGIPLMPPQMLHMIPAAQGLRDRRGLVECGGAARNRLQGRHREGRVRPGLPDDGRDEGHGRHRAARGRDDRAAVPDAVVDDVPARHLLGNHRHRRGSAGRAPGLPAGARRRHRNRDQGRPLRHVRHRRGRGRHQCRPPGIAGQRRPHLRHGRRRQGGVVRGPRGRSPDAGSGGVWRAVSAVDEIFARSGGNAARMDKPLQRYWRDVHVGHLHAIHMPGTTYHASALSSLGIEPPQGPLRALI